MVELETKTSSEIFDEGKEWLNKIDNCPKALRNRISNELERCATKRWVSKDSLEKRLTEIACGSALEAHLNIQILMTELKKK